MERGLQDAFFSPLQVLERGPGGEVSESPENQYLVMRLMFNGIHSAVMEMKPFKVLRDFHRGLFPHLRNDRLYHLSNNRQERQECFVRNFLGVLRVLVVPILRIILWG